MIKEITSYNFDEILFEYFEGTLNDAEKKQFLEFIDSNPSYKKDFELWGQSMVASDNIEVPVGLEDMFTKKESFWKSSKGKISLVVIAAALATTAVVLTNNGEEKIEKTEVQEYKTSIVPQDSVMNTSTSPSAAPSINAIPNTFSTQQKRESIKSEKQVSGTSIVLPSIFGTKEFEPMAEPIVQEEKVDTVSNTNTAKTIANESTKTVLEKENEKSTVQPTNKNPKFDVELNNDKLGKPKNIIDMQQKLDEN